MTYAVDTTTKADRAIGRHLIWRRDNLSQAAADRWFAALDRAMDSLSGMPESRPICRESDDLPGGTYREHYFGVGKSKTHRLVFRVRGGAVQVVAVRGLSQPDLTPGDI